MTVTREEKNALIRAEVLRRAGIAELSASESLLRGTFKQQRDFILDSAPLKAAFCTRRAAKSYTAGLMLYRAALDRPGSSSLFIGLTRGSAKAIIWKDVLKVINRGHKLDAKFNETDLTATLPNGSVIYCLGADSDEGEREKLLGQKYALVVVDEAASYHIDLRALVYATLKPAVADYRGTICLIGTPGNLTKSLFFDITHGTELGWSVHKWTTFDNPYMATNWQLEIDDLTRANPLVVETPWFQQMYLGQWVIDQDKLVYRYSTERNSVDAMPAGKGEPRYVLGIDLGYNDDSAFVLSAYHRESPKLYFIKTIKRAGMDVTDVANQIKDFYLHWPIDVAVVDGANKQAIAELNNRHGLALQTADKTGKEDFITLMNSDFIQGNIVAVRGKTESLVKEWQELIWLDRPGTISQKRVEHPSLPNHLADAALYAWRHCYSYLFKTLPQAKPRAGTPAWYDAEAKNMLEAAELRFVAQKQKQDAGDLWLDVDPQDQNW